MESVKVMKANERHLAQFQNVMDLVKMIMAGNKHLAQLLIQKDLMEEAMMVEDKHHAQTQKEMHSMKVVERWFMVPMEQMVGDSASMASPFKTTTPRISYTVASNAAAKKKKKVPISKIQVCLVLFPHVKAVTSKIGSWDNVCYPPCGSHVKSHTQKLDFSKMQAVCAKVILGEPTI
jgi:hypothetical protein